MDPRHRPQGAGMVYITHLRRIFTELGDAVMLGMLVCIFQHHATRKKMGRVMALDSDCTIGLSFLFMNCWAVGCNGKKFGGLGTSGNMILWLKGSLLRDSIVIFWFSCCNGTSTHGQGVDVYVDG